MNASLKRRAALMLSAVLFILIFGCSQKQTAADYPIRPVAFTQVQIGDAFWAPRIETNRRVTIPYAFRMCEETGRVDNLRKAGGTMTGPYLGRRFNDSDIFKAMEAAAYALAQHPDPALEATMDSLTAIIGRAQEADGYLYAARTVDPAHPAPGAGAERWVHLQGSHELYNVGHLYEAAVAYDQATGKRALLDIALRNADLVDRVFGPGKRLDTPGHQEIEIGLPKLFRVTGDPRYLDLARFFLDQRGREHASLPYPDTSRFAIYNGRPYKQDHLPVLEQREAVGHAVRAGYQYAAMADVAALTGDTAYVTAIDRLWEDVVSGKMYLTGGIGSRYVSEALGDRYELPNDSAYTETCASVANVLWNQRMFLLHGDAQYIDVLERTLYNGLLSGVSLSGDRFFYQNPLASAGGYERSEWFDCACCPPNIARFLPSLSGYVYAVDGPRVYVNLYVAGKASVAVDGQALRLIQETAYPWQGRIRLRVETESPQTMELALRIPGWVRDQAVPSDLYRFAPEEHDPITLTVNDEAVAVKPVRGYALIRRAWQSGDEVVLDLPMPVREVLCHEGVAENRGRVAFQRGPLVYCAEEADNGDVPSIRVSQGTVWTVRSEPELLGGVTVLEGGGLRRGEYVPLKLIPYYAWALRGAGQMAVWLPLAPVPRQNESEGESS